MAVLPRRQRRRSWLLLAAAISANCGAVPTARADTATSIAATAAATTAVTAAAAAAAAAGATSAAATTAAAAVAAAASTFMWASSLQSGAAVVESFSFDSSSVFSSSSSSSSSSSGGDGGAPADSGDHSNRQQRDRVSCQPSDDPDYTCLLPHPPGSFEGEVLVYLSAEEELLSVKVVVPRAFLSGSVDVGGGWASLGFSPNGRMAGPSEAVVGFAAAEDGVGGPSVLRYRMDGYSTSSVSPLPDHHQILTGQAVETAADGSLVVRFKRPFAASFPPLHEDACVPMAVVAAVKAVEGRETGRGAAETGGVASLGNRCGLLRRGRGD